MRSKEEIAEEIEEAERQMEDNLSKSDSKCKTCRDEKKCGVRIPVKTCSGYIYRVH